MDKDQKEQKKFLIDQLEWCKKQDSIFQEIEDKLYKMKEIAEFASAHDLPSFEIEKLNDQLEELSKEVHNLEQQLQSDVH